MALSTTILPAYDGFYIKSGGKILPVIAWLCEPYSDGSGLQEVHPITPHGVAYNTPGSTYTLHEADGKQL